MAGTQKHPNATGYKPKQKQISKEKLAKFVADYAVNGHATNAALKAENGQISLVAATHKGHRWLKRPDVQAALSYVNKRLAEGSTVAVDRIVSLVGDENPRVALDASKYLVDQAHGKALQRTETQTVNLNIDTVLDMAI